jgi:hypothetical protein
MRYPDEPHTVINGVAIHVGAVDLLARLCARGHTVALDEDGRVTVDRVEDLPDDTQFLLDALDEDLAILLRAGGPTVH